MAASNALKAPAHTDAEILEHVRNVHNNRLLPKSPIYGFLLSDIVIPSAGPGLVIAQLTLTEQHCNSKGGLHGSCTATIVDWIGGLAIASTDLRDSTGVSTDIHVTYVSSAKAGDVIEIEGRADKVGGTLGFTGITIWKLADGQRKSVVAKGSHTKYVRI